MSTALQFPTTITDIAGVGLHEIAARFGTPCFVYDAESIRRRIADLAGFDVVRYAQKALSNLAVLDLVRRQGCLVDTVSAGEIERSLAAGFAATGDPAPIVFTADLFDRDALRLCVDREIHVNCGSPDMIDQLGERAGGRAITLRINPGFGHGHSRKTNTGGEHSKHGIWHEQIAECLARAKRWRMTVSGLHMHIGSGTDLEHLSRVAGAMERAALEVGESVQTISCGGGLPVPYREGDPFVDLDAYLRLWDATRGRLARAFGHPLRLEIEPGRYLVAECGFLLSEIRAIKKQGRNTFYMVDAGFNNLARPVLYGAYHALAVAPASGEPATGTLADVVVGGPLCESGDIFTQQEGGTVAPRPLPPASVGDLLVIQTCGAYGAVMGSNYCSKVHPAEVLIDAGQAHLIRRRQPLEDLFRFESIPGR